MNDTTATAIASHAAPPKEPGLTSLGLAAAAEAIRNGDITSETYATALLQRERALADIKSFITIDVDAVLAAAKNADKARRQGQWRPFWACPLASRTAI